MDILQTFPLMPTILLFLPTTFFKYSTHYSFSQGIHSKLLPAPSLMLFIGNFFYEMVNLWGFTDLFSIVTQVFGIWEIVILFWKLRFMPEACQNKTCQKLSYHLHLYVLYLCHILYLYHTLYVFISASISYLLYFLDFFPYDNIWLRDSFSFATISCT